MKLSTHFELDEMIRSELAARSGWTNEPTPEIVDNLRRLCVEILEPLRNSLSKPLFITSGYRSVQLNTAVGGSPHSDHMVGNAADIVVPGVSVQDVARAVRRLSPYVPLKQAIIEFGQWVHVSILSDLDLLVDGYEPSFLVASRGADGKTLYEPWGDA